MLFYIYVKHCNENLVVDKLENLLTVGLKNRATETANDGSPRFPVNWNETKSRRRLHVGDASAMAAP